MAARRIIWGKCLNAGQVCISPDYVLCSSRIMNLLKTEMEKYITQFYTDDVKSSADYGRILNEKFFDKIINKIKKSNLDVPECDRESLYIKPTVYANVSPDSEIMKEEIFAPVLPLIECNSFTEAIEFINKIPKPLAIYLFTYNDEIKNSFLLKTSSGGFCLNDVIMQNSVNNLPFGGVGASGIGRYGGYSGFKQFSNMRSVLERCSLFHQVREPPYTDKSIKILNWLMRKPRKGVLNWIKSWNM
ncbi:hypothetical protein A3Q56_02989 [Intoshia linei]|uniref:Aldehyde dehydrogenase domain-containing protein n=1 Tax=Intoshia linei TaxID=1819745 RepID=A0A177B6L4_9BILA|nr:hypothetical protein A3Q56_02989 [Intoshia linei]